MSKKRKYNFYNCMDCEKEFLSTPVEGKASRRVFCPLCGENLYTELVMPLWIERPFQAGRPWTPEEDETILVSRKAGYTYHQIAEALQGRTFRAVGRRAQRLNKGIRQAWTTGDNEKIRAAAARGLTYSQIAELFKGERTVAAVQRQCTRIVGKGKMRNESDNRTAI